MQKVDGVQTVKVSLKDGLTILDLKPDNTVMLAKLRQVIKDNGFVAKEAQVIARGRLVAETPNATFEVSGTGERLTITGRPEQTRDEWRFMVPAAR